MIVFLIDKITPRWEYTFEFIFGIRRIEFQLVDDSELFDNLSGKKFKIKEEWGALLKNEEIHSEMKYDDLLSKIFFVLTRMEEYGAKSLDEHGRFPAKESWQYKNDSLELCICDRWAMEFIEHVSTELKTNLEIKITETEIIPTFDIDNAFAYKYKTGKRKLLSELKDLVTGNTSRIKERKAVLSGKENDPYDAYTIIKRIAKNFPVRLFWLVGDYGHPDFNISIETAEIKTLVEELNQSMVIGIHPSYRANNEPKLLEKEISRLTEIVGQKTEISRQHFLKLRFPATYQNLIQNGIKADFSMGFADEVGFRNGTAHPFPWFDLQNNVRTQLVVHPFAYMDGTLNEYKNMNIEKAEEKIQDLYQEVKQHGGQFSFIWHNETITDYGKWKGWSQVLEYTLTLNNTL